MRWYLFLLMICFVQALTDAQSVDLADDEDTIQLAPELVSLDSLALSLADGLSSDLDKITAIYQFVTHEISYDHKAYHQGHRRINQSNHDVLNRKRAVCWGYAQLITELCGHLHIPCYTVTGYAKDSPLPRRAFEKANHAWNAVMLDSRWHLIDATWGHALLKGENIFSLESGINYFLSSPELFIISHFPLMPMWQLLECPRTYEQYLLNSTGDPTSNCTFSYTDSIAAFRNLPYLDQQLKIMTTAYSLNKTESNRGQIGHALIDLAIDKKEKGDALMENDSLAMARELLAAASNIFSLAENYCQFYPWQMEAQLFAEINLAQVSYQLMRNSLAEGRIIQSHFERAQVMLAKVQFPERQTASIQELLNSYLSVLSGWLEDAPIRD